MPQEMFSQIATWMNDNAGLLAFLLFVATLLLGWASGIFAFLRHKPKFKLSLIEGPTFCCIYEAGGELKKHGFLRLAKIRTFHPVVLSWA